MEAINPVTRRARLTKSYSDEAGNASTAAFHRDSCGDHSFDFAGLSCAGGTDQRFLKVPSGLPPSGRDFDPVPTRSEEQSDTIAMPTFAADTFIYVEDWSNRSFDAHSVMTLREFRKRRSIERRQFDTKSDSLLFSSSSEGELEGLPSRRRHSGSQSSAASTAVTSRRPRPRLSDSAYQTKENSTESRGFPAAKAVKEGESEAK